MRKIKLQTIDRKKVYATGPRPKCRIYCLINPINNKVFYVGKTFKTLHERLAGHCCSRGTIKMRPVLIRIKKKGLRPIIKELEVVHHNSLPYRRESYWICKLWNEGNRLCNVNLMY